MACGNVPNVAITQAALMQRIGNAGANRTSSSNGKPMGIGGDVKTTIRLCPERGAVGLPTTVSAYCIGFPQHHHFTVNPAELHNDRRGS
ncbi:MAG: hypothetical protein ACR5LC_00940 [Symbiopectobacterium sp.]|uniref:hypothetical protein n=1 Tax=Symbiopectobacterium sp. TaxID=2952789 RepID=UPI003F3C2F08